MHLQSDWKKTLRYAWSVRFLAIAALLQGFEAALPILPTFIVIPPGILLVLTIAATVAAFVSRTFISQKVFRNANR